MLTMILILEFEIFYRRATKEDLACSCPDPSSNQTSTTTTTAAAATGSQATSSTTRSISTRAPVPPRNCPKDGPVRKVVIRNMCRCPQNHCTNRHGILHNVTTKFVQRASLATGPAKQFEMIVTNCSCVPGQCNEYTNLGEGPHLNCRKRNETGRMKWTEMPDTSVEQGVPLFVGALTFRSPKSLAGGMENWAYTLFHDTVKSEIADLFVHCNDRTPSDDFEMTKPLRMIQDKGFDVPVSGKAGVNWNVGRVIAEHCRSAEQVRWEEGKRNF
jgi:hypothetical protein